MHVVTIIPKVVLFLIGLLLLYTSIFTYEDEQRIVQNKLADIWLNLSIQEERGNKRSLAFLQSIQVVLKYVQRYFGDNLLSGQSVLAVICISFFSASIFFDINAIEGDMGPGFLWKDIVAGLLALLLFFRFRPRRQLYCWAMALAFSGAYTLFYWQQVPQRLSTILSLVTLPTLGASVIMLLNLKITLYLLRRTLRINQWYWITLLYLATLYLSIMLYAVLNRVVESFFISKSDDEFVIGMNMDFVESITAYVTLFPLLLNAILILLFILVCTTNIVWPLLKLPVRALYEHKLIKKRTLMLGIALFFMGAAFPNWDKTSLLNIVHHVLDFLK